MKPVSFDIQFTDEVMVARGGLPLIGQLLNATDFARHINGVDLGANAAPVISHADVAMSMVGLICLGRPDYTAIDDERASEVLGLGLGVKELPSEATLRQRLDQLALEHLPAIMDIVRCTSADLIGTAAPAITPCLNADGRRWVAVDADVAPFDNSKTKKEGVERTYDGTDGYAPIFAYLGQEGYMLNADLRPGSQHSQKDAIGFLRGALAQAESILAARQIEARLLLRLDAAHDAADTMKLIDSKKNHADLILKRNPRGESAEQWLETAWAYGKPSTPREGKIVLRGETWEERGGRPRRVIFEVIERTSTPDGQQLLQREIEIHSWWTTLSRRAASVDEVIQLYRDHATSEQFHSELKSDLAMERLASGKFATNALLTGLAMVAYNVLRLIGQNGLSLDAQMPEAARPALPRDEHQRPRMKRRRLRNVVQDLIWLAVKLTRSGRGWGLRISRSNPWSALFVRLYEHFASLVPRRCATVR